MRILSLLICFFSCGLPAVAREIPYYRMDSYAFLSDAVVLCDEKKIQFVETKYRQNLKTTHSVVTCKVTESLKGDLKAGSTLEITYDPVFGRYRAGEGGHTDISRGSPRIVQPKYLPVGKDCPILEAAGEGRRIPGSHCQIDSGSGNPSVRAI